MGHGMTGGTMQLKLAIGLIGLLGLTTTDIPAAAQTERLDQPKVSDAITQGDLPGAARRARELSDANDIEGQYNLALFYWHGVGIPQNFDEAIRWSTLAGVRGHAKAAIARRVMSKTLEPIVVQKAMEWSRLRLVKMAESGDDAALVSMARSYSPDFSFANDVEAYYWAALAFSAGKSEVRRQRDDLVTKIKQADLIKTQQKANNWFAKFRKDRL
jgi:TPR repeat protein